MKLDVTEAIMAWNSVPMRKHLILMGARQLRKSWLMADSAKTAYPNDAVSVNFMEIDRLEPYQSKGTVRDYPFYVLSALLNKMKEYQ